MLGGPLPLVPLVVMFFHVLLIITTTKKFMRGVLKALVWFWIIDETLILTESSSLVLDN